VVDPTVSIRWTFCYLCQSIKIFIKTLWTFASDIIFNSVPSAPVVCCRTLAKRMSIGSSWQNFSNSTPPERGSFPLDYKGVCNEFVQAYISCLKKNNKDANICKPLSRKYLSCRMANGLMDKEAFSSLGFQEKDPE
jgi:hypothetical protein